MAEGTVKWFDKKKGYGFISYGEDTDVFVHYTGFLDQGMKTLEENEKVSFEIVEGEKVPRAEKVTRAQTVEE
jgi:CspA family cold shock protein